MNRAQLALAVAWIALANALAATEPPAAWQLTLRAARPGAVFDVAETPRVTALVRNVAGHDPAAKIEFDVRDFEGRQLATGQESAQVPPGQTRPIDLPLGDPGRLPHGEYLSLHVRLVADGRCQAQWRKGFGFLPRREVTTPPEQSPFGLLNDAGDWPLMARLGVRHVRLNWNWNERPLEWTSRYKVSNCPLMNEANAFVCGQLTEKEYAAFIRESVRRYKGYIHYWQLGNEFDIFHREGPKSYVESQRVGYAAAKAEDPSCVVVGGSITELQIRREGFRDSLDLGLARYCDIYDFHFYSDLATTQNLLDYIHATCKAHHAEKPLWVTETTQVGMFDPDNRNQAEYVFKRFTHLLANGVSVICWHALSWPYPFSADKVQATAIIDYEGFARPSLFAYAALTRELAGARFVRRRDAGPGVYVLEFARGPRTLVVLWSESGRQSYQLRHRPGELSVTFPSGKRIGRSSPGLIDVPLGKSPAIYDLPATSAGDRFSSDRPAVTVVQGGESKVRPEDCLATLVGPGVNQPDPFPGYGGFVGWVSPIRLHSGDWLVGFSAGYWHASAPTPLRFSPKTLEAFHKIGLPADIVAPTGGRAMIVRSTDEGKTWSKPVTLIDTPDDDRHPAWVELPDGTLLCSMFTDSGAELGDIIKHPENAYRTGVIRSFDHGKTWEKQPIRPPSPFLADESDGPLVLLKDGSVLLTISGAPKEGGPSQATVFTSQDRGATWRLGSVVKAGHELDEANATQLPDGRLVMMARPEGDICWSSDQGRTWTAPVTFGMRMYAPSLYVLRDGTLVCLHGCYAPGYGGLRLILSTDGGRTWIAPAKDHGFLVDHCYGYGKATEFPDGSLLITDQATGGHTTSDARNMSIRCLRVRIRADHAGVDLLPMPNRHN